VESVLEKKKKGTLGRICGKARFSAWSERVGGWMTKSGESLEEVIGMGELEFDRLV